jgi:steroid delta-isomerase-like uncharacterized protein
MARPENIEALKNSQTKFKARDLEGHLQLYSDSVLHHGFSGRIRPGIAGLRDHYSALLKAFPDMRVDLEDIIADDQKVVHRFTFYGTHRGEYLGQAPTMKTVVAAGVQIHLFQTGRCVEVWQILDTFRFMSQIGMVPPLRSTG